MTNSIKSSLTGIKCGGGIVAATVGCSPDGNELLIVTSTDLSQDMSITWPDAELACSQCRIGGFSDWRLPTADELKMMYGNLSTLREAAFTQKYYWSSTPGYGPGVWRTQGLFGDGYDPLLMEGSSPTTVRAVRTTTARAAFLEMHRARFSTLNEFARRDLIQDCLPIWILAPNENYFPKPFQTYKVVDVAAANVKDRFVALEPIPDQSRHSKTGNDNSARPDDNLIAIPRYYEIEGNSLKGLTPGKMPTYAFYVEKDNDEIWIYYFIFFGFNQAPYTGPIKGNHFADWVHVTVALKRASLNTAYRPYKCYFSAHAGGRKVLTTEPIMKFYVQDQSATEPGTVSFATKTFDQLPQEGPFHVRVFLAWGSHEAYVDAGRQGLSMGLDLTGFGEYCVIPYVDQLSAGTVGNQYSAKSSGTLYAPVYAWDLSAPEVYQPAIDRPDQYDTGDYLNMSPRTLFPVWGPAATMFQPPDDSPDSDFYKMWMTRSSEYRIIGDSKMGGSTMGPTMGKDTVWRVIGRCGADVNAGGIFGLGEGAAWSPLVKLVSWADNFDM